MEFSFINLVLEEVVTMKKICSVILSVIIILLATYNEAYATEISRGAEEASVFSGEIKERIVETIRNTIPEERSKALKELLSGSREEDKKESSARGAVPVAYRISNLQAENVTSMKNAVVEDVIYVDEETYVEFYDSGIFVVHRTYVENEDVASDENERATYTSRSRLSYTNTLKSEADAYNAFGYIVVAVWAKGYFTYDGLSAPTAYLEECRYEKYGILNAWGVDDWTTDTTQNSSAKTASFYGAGNFYWGITYEGNGWKIQNYAITVGYICDKNGQTKNLVKGF